MKNKIINKTAILLLIFCMTFTITMSKPREVEAVAPAVVYGGYTLLVAFIATCGVTIQGVDGGYAIADYGIFAKEIWVGLPPELQKEWNTLGEQYVDFYPVSGMGVLQVRVPDTLADKTRAEILKMIKAPTEPVPGKIYPAQFYNGIMSISQYPFFESMQIKVAEYSSEYPYWIATAQGGSAIFLSMFKNIPYVISSSNNGYNYIVDFSGLAVQHLFLSNGNYWFSYTGDSGHGNVRSIGSSYIMSNFKLKYGEQILNDAIALNYDGSVAVDYGNWGKGTSDQTKPMNVPFVPDPLLWNGSTPTGSISADTVIQGLNSMDNAFSDGQTVTTDMGKVIDNVPDMLKTPAESLTGEISPPTSIPILGNILGFIQSILQYIVSIWQSLVGFVTSFFDLSATWNLNGILDGIVPQIIAKTPLANFQQSYNAFKNMSTGTGSPPVITINLNKLVGTASNVGKFNNGFKNEEVKVIDFAMLDNPDIKFFNMTIIQMIRALLSLSMVSVTAFYIYRKIIPDDVIK